MVVEPEIGNKYDADAMVIKMPKLENIPIRYHDEMLPSSTERVKDISGKVIGRVPANICKLFRELLDRGYISSILCFCIDNPSHSKHPHYSQAYQKRSGKNDRQGGGGVIPCRFELECNAKDRLRAFSLITKG